MASRAKSWRVARSSERPPARAVPSAASNAARCAPVSVMEYASGLGKSLGRQALRPVMGVRSIVIGGLLPRLHLQEALLDGRVAGELVGRAAELDAALVHDVEAVRQCQGNLEGLLDEQDRRAGLVDPAQDLGEMLDEHRGEALRRLVDEHELRAGDEPARDGEHLLLSAREETALLGRALAQPREHLEDLLDARRPIARPRRHHAEAEILDHGQVRQHAALFRYPGDAPADDLVGLPPRDLLTRERNAPA